MSRGMRALEKLDSAKDLWLYFYFDPSIVVWNRAMKSRHSADLWAMARLHHPGLPEELSRDRVGRPMGGTSSVSISYTPGVAVLGLAKNCLLGIDIELASRRLNRAAVEGALGGDFVNQCSDIELLQKCMALESVFKAAARPQDSLRSVAVTGKHFLDSTKFTEIQGIWALAVCRILEV